MAHRDVCSGGSCHLLAISRLLRNGVFQGADESGQEYGNKTGVPEASHPDPQYHVQGIRLSLPLGEMGVGLLNLGVTGVLGGVGSTFWPSPRVSVTQDPTQVVTCMRGEHGCQEVAA